MKRSPATPLPPPEERRRLRESASLTLAQLAQRVGVRSETVRSWESGRTNPRGRTRERYARLLSTLTEDAEQPVPAPSPAGVRRPKWARGGDEVTVFTGRQGADDGMVTVGLEKLADEGEHRGVAPEPSRFTRAPGLVADPGTEPDLTPAQAFDTLYGFWAPALVRQTYLLTGRRELARESVERAFQLAWERWPEVARDPEPASWVRAAAYEWALSPWHRFRPRYRNPEPPPADESQRALLDALLHLPPHQRRTLVLYDGLGIDLPDTAAETEASTPAAANRLLAAREAVAERLPELSDPVLLHRRLAELASAERLRAAGPEAVRDASERRARFWTRSAVVFTAALIGTTVLTLCTAPTRYEPPVPPGRTVQGIPPRVAPGPLSEKERKLRSKLREELLHGPQRLAPQPR